MSYNIIAAVAADPDLAHRVAACFAEQTPADAGAPETMAMFHLPRLAAEPGWAAAYASAVAAGIERPGHDESVITDSMILAAVQKHTPGA